MTTETSATSALAHERARALEGGGPRWHLLYLLLAAFDVLTVCASLFFNHRLVAIHTESLQVAELISGVSRSAGAANAPGNDVFDSRDVTAERSRLLLANAEFDTALRDLGARVPGRAVELASIRAAMDAMGAEAELIFHAFEAGEPDRAGERMATMDRRYAEVNGAIAELGRGVRHEQFEQTAVLERFEYLVGGSVALMVMAALYYGHRLRQEVRMTEVQRRLHTAELAASEEKFRSLVETTKTIPFEMDPRTLRFTYVGPQALQLLGIPAECWLESGFLAERMHPQEREHCLQALSTVGREHVEVECSLRLTDQTRIYVRMLVAVVGRAVRGPGQEAPEPILRGVLLDVTERRQLEAELRQAQKLESVGRLAAGVAHEINTPVQFVNDSVHFVREAFGELGGLMGRYGELRAAVAEGRALPEQAQELERVETESDLAYLLENVPRALERSLDGLQRVASIVSSMKEFAHPDRKEMTPFDLNQAIRSTLIISHNEYKYVADLETDLAEIPAVTCLGGEINQVVLNVVVNAAHAIGDVVAGKGTKGRITVRTRQTGEDVLISIADTGGGIPDHVRERVFDPFFTTKGVGKGTGQGLAIARSVIVEKHGGELWFESEPGKGTTFFIRLPIEGKGQRRAGAAA